MQINNLTKDKLNMLIVDDEEAALHSLHFLFHNDYNVTISSSGEKALELINIENYQLDIVICDERMAGIKGHELLEKIHSHDPDTICILATGYADMASLVSAVNKGHIYNYIEKPWVNSDLKSVINRAAEYHNMRKENKHLTQSLKEVNSELEIRIKERTAELERRNKQLLHEIEERKIIAAELHTAIAETKIANKAKSEFFANMSHELRTPLNSIIGFTYRVLKATKNSLDEQHTLALSTAHKNAEHLLELINMILDLAKVEAGKMQLNLVKVNICDTLRDLETIMEPIAEQNKTTLRLLIPDDEIEVEIDPIKIVQIASNLLSNAIKFTPNGTVTLELTLTTMAEQQAFCIKVCDTGCGIKEYDQKNLFQKFTQVKKYYTKVGQGSGLGLAIVKEYVQLHGGKVSFSSTHRKGSVFTVIIPTKVI